MILVKIPLSSDESPFELFLIYILPYSRCCDDPDEILRTQGLPLRLLIEQLDELGFGDAASLDRFQSIENVLASGERSAEVHGKHLFDWLVFLPENGFRYGMGLVPFSHEPPFLCKPQKLVFPHDILKVLHIIETILSLEMEQIFGEGICIHLIEVRGLEDTLEIRDGNGIISYPLLVSLDLFDAVLFGLRDLLIHLFPFLIIPVFLRESTPESFPLLLRSFKDLLLVKLVFLIDFS